jgi:hypothetical protein
MLPVRSVEAELTAGRLGGQAPSGRDRGLPSRLRLGTVRHMAYIEDLRAFVEVADRGSFTRAAAHLFISQPTLSRGIGRLERQYMLKWPNLYLSKSAYSARYLHPSLVRFMA